MSNLLQHINMTTLSLFDSLQPFINSSITSFSDAHSDDTKFLSLTLCNNNGYFKPSAYECLCDFGFFDMYCTRGGNHIWKKGWGWFRGIFAGFYLLLSILTWYYFLQKFLSEETCLKRVQRLILTPKYLIIINLIVISNSIYT